MLPRYDFRNSLLVKAQYLQQMKLFMPVFLGNGNYICCLTLYAKGENVIAHCLRKYLISSQWIYRKGEYACVDWLFHVVVILAPRSEDILFDNLMTYDDGDTCINQKFKENLKSFTYDRDQRNIETLYIA